MKNVFDRLTSRLDMSEKQTLRLRLSQQKPQSWNSEKKNWKNRIFKNFGKIIKDEAHSMGIPEGGEKR